jgi:hypothetical protein
MTPRASRLRSTDKARVRRASAEPWASGVIEWLTMMQQVEINGLLVGPAPVTDAVLVDLMPTLRQPLLERWSDGTPWDEHRQLGTLVLHDLLAVSPREQRSLLAWMNGPGGHCRIVSVSCLPVFPLLEDGDFLATLYYRLNVIYAEDRSALD